MSCLKCMPNTYTSSYRWDQDCNQWLPATYSLANWPLFCSSQGGSSLAYLYLPSLVVILPFFLRLRPSESPSLPTWIHSFKDIRVLHFYWASIISPSQGHSTTTCFSVSVFKLLFDRWLIELLLILTTSDVDCLFMSDDPSCFFCGPVSASLAGLLPSPQFIALEHPRV